MKKAISAIVILSIVLLSSCSKNNPGNTSSSNSWSFKGITYTTTQATSTSGVFSAECVSTNQTINGGNVTLHFPNGVTPTFAQTTIVGEANSTNQVWISLTTASAAGSVVYNSTGGFQNDNNVVLTFSNGKMNISGSNIIMSNASVSSDTSLLNLNVTQTQ